jgi:uncharacterized protein YegP (UPF0339 family)
MAAKYHLKRASDGQFHFSLHASNGEIVLSSELYKAKASARDGIESVRQNAHRDGAFELKVAVNGKHYFVLKASNGDRAEPDVCQPRQCRRRGGGDWLRQRRRNQRRLLNGPPEGDALARANDPRLHSGQCNRDRSLCHTRVPMPAFQLPEQRILTTLHTVVLATEVLSQAGIPRARLLEGSGIAEADLQNAEKFVSHAQELRVFANALSCPQDPALGLYLGLRMHASAYGILGYSMLASRTLRDALQHAMHYPDLLGTYFAWRCRITATRSA